jgi:hypothetical protein
MYIVTVDDHRPGIMAVQLGVVAAARTVSEYSVVSL